ncbi:MULTISPECIES: 3'(2'),5'-bisphosphate nucleotidase CysQ [Thermomonospora]|uniref:inositol-phosphate phosphatase n=1 Tax=Thermomonospora cellulosilytica TaxID=1411118 RepID=A0A7W3MX88_9ACTN|nr:MULTISPECIES: 3'(2'),5'-bisphosphate nucleotidase CysQ [Thermomonospora]MBA9003546.1 3'(2'), 5'-bisphosphate nucleotidase [Thermomonospora cellulosilytica]
MPPHSEAAFEPTPETDDHALAAELATAAGRVLLDIRARVGHADGKALKNAGDQGSHEFLMAELARTRPGDAVLSEEGKDDLARLEAERVWIVDPLDGTREFSEEGRTDWAVHVALWERGRLVAGAVALPAQDRTLHTVANGGAVVSAKEGQTLLVAPEPPPGLLRIAVSRTRPPEFVQRLAERLDVKVELVPIGSAGAKISAVLLGDVDAYVHAGGQYEWDNAAPAAVALAAGAHATRIDGTALTYNNRDVLLPDILVCHPVSASMVLAGIRDVSPGLSG